MKYLEVLSGDPVMKSLIEKYGELSLTESKDYFDDLISAVIGQLLSGKAADTIYKRVAALCKERAAAQTNSIIKRAADAGAGGGGITPADILAVSDEALRAAGSSYGKIRCMKALAQAVTGKALDLEGIKRYDNEEIIRQLTVIKGIGRWTAEMFLIFSLAREDVFSQGDGGLNSAMNRLYGKGNPLSKNDIITITGKWQPYRSYASLYLWKSLDNR